MTIPFEVLVIGAGRIASGFDTPGGQRILTHAHAWSRQGSRLAFVDPDPVALGEAVSRWGAEGFTDVAQAVESRAWDVVVVAAPDEHHLSIVEAIASHPWKALVLEKPPATGRVEWVGIQRLLEPRIADVVVNFTRRWAPGIVRLADDIHAGQWGDFAFGRGVYGNGLVHNGSHLTDLLTWFLGRLEPESISAIVPDRPRDPSTGFRIRTESDKIVDIAAMDCSAFTIFEVDLFFTKGRVRLCSTGGGLELSRIRPSAEHVGYLTLGEVETASAGIEDAFAGLVSDVARHVRGGDPATGSIPLIRPGFDLCLRLAEMRDAFRS